LSNTKKGTRMNANELADELERFESFNGDVFFGTCAVMLRQQQEEIYALKMEIHSLTYGERLAEYLKKAKG